MSARRDELTAATRTADTQLEQVAIALEDTNDRDDAETYETASLLTEKQRALFITQSLPRQLLSKIQDDAVSRAATGRPSRTIYDSWRPQHRYFNGDKLHSYQRSQFWGQAVAWSELSTMVAADSMVNM